MAITADVRPHTSEAAHEPPDNAQPGWVRPALLVLLVATAVLYLWGLGSGGWANDYYAAAVQAGTQDWKAWLFGSLDSGNAITVDKPPAALWVMALSGRIFGFSAFTMLLPQALMGVGAVALLYATVRTEQRTRGGADRRRRTGADPGRGVDVPVQQPRRAAGAADGGRPPTASCGPPRRPVPAGSHWRAASWASPSSPRCCRPSWSCPAFALVFLVAAPRRRVEARRQLRGRRRSRWSSRRLVRRPGGSVARRVAALHRRLDRQQPAASSRWATTAWAGSSAAEDTGRRPGGGPVAARRRHAALRRRARHRPAVRAVDGHRDLVAAAGGAGRPARRTVVHPPHRRAPTGPRRAAAVGRLAAGHGGVVFSFMEGTFTRTTRWPWRPRSRRRRDHGARAVAGQAVPDGAAALARCPRSPVSGRSCCWAARRTGCPGCGGWC